MKISVHRSEFTAAVGILGGPAFGPDDSSLAGRAFRPWSFRGWSPLLAAWKVGTEVPTSETGNHGWTCTSAIE